MTNPNYKYKSDEIEITIHKPLYGTFCYIYEGHLREARRKEIPLHIIIPGVGEAWMSPESWMDGGNKIQKEFKIPGHPMTMWGNHLNTFMEKPVS